MRRKTGYCLLIVVLVCIFGLISCMNEKKEKINEGIEPTENQGTIPKAEVTKGPTDLPFSEAEKLTIYTINSDTNQKEMITAMLPTKSEVTAKLIVDTVIDSMADSMVVVGIDNVTEEGDSVIVSFKNDKSPVAATDADLESEILDAIAQSLIDNLAGCKQVIFRVMGKAYQSDHLSFDLNQIYLEKKD